jgi:hypothetical protein
MDLSLIFHTNCLLPRIILLIPGHGTASLWHRLWQKNPAHRHGGIDGCGAHISDCKDSMAILQREKERRKGGGEGKHLKSDDLYVFMLKVKKAANR